MAEIILHHYDLSPYSQKIRSLLGYKKLAWRSVLTPVVMPKPELVALTGGYRKAPVMQLGRDVYCDSRLIVEVLDRLHPLPRAVPPAHAASCAAFAGLEQKLFFGAIAAALQPAGLQWLAQQMGAELLQQFFKDREGLFAGGTLKMPGPELAALHFLPLLAALDSQLEGREFLIDTVPTLADFAAFHPVNFVLLNAGAAPLLAPFRQVLAWAERMHGLGEGRRSELPAEQALLVARDTASAQPFEGEPLPLPKLKPGDAVVVQATDYGCDPVSGTLLHASAMEIALRRNDPRAGEVVVHFPRDGFRVTAAS